MIARAFEIIQFHIPWLTIQAMVIVIAVYVILEAALSLWYPKNGKERVCIWARASRILAGGILILLVV